MDGPLPSRRFTMRRFILTATLLAAACDTRQGRPVGALPGPGITPDETTSTGEAPRLDLPDDAPLPDLPPETGDTSTTSTGTSGSSLGTAEPGTTGTTGTTSGSTGVSSSGDSSSSTGEPGTTSTGEPPPPVCGDGVCEASERAPCWGPGWCFGDCYKAPECKSDCACTPGAAAAKNFCHADPMVVCEATVKGGYCDPDGNGLPDDADSNRGFYEWTASCT